MIANVDSTNSQISMKLSITRKLHSFYFVAIRKRETARLRFIGFDKSLGILEGHEIGDAGVDETRFSEASLCGRNKIGCSGVCFGRLEVDESTRTLIQDRRLH